ncbi:amelogenin, X isoform isoform X2 [Protopterus annectens]|uniref:amelogenin, X isoform isoform X2 n=1 Tax=Protopterus annectens TaxID=7888 RepID=UPI001CFAB361|nr:amelogenin, X isoform isoform X2 [Protopterus annectens]
MNTWLLFSCLLTTSLAIPLPPAGQHANPGVINISYELLSPYAWLNKMMRQNQQYPSFGFENMQPWPQQPLRPVQQGPQPAIPQMPGMPGMPQHPMFPTWVQEVEHVLPAQQQPAQQQPNQQPNQQAQQELD